MAPNHIYSSYQQLLPLLDVVDAGPNCGVWCRTGKSPLGLVARPNIVTDYLGFDEPATSKLGQCIHDNYPLRPYAATLTGEKFPFALSDLSPDILNQNNFRTSKSVTLQNGDVCPVGQWVLLWIDEQHDPIVARVREIIQWKGSLGDKTSSPDGVLLEVGAVSGTAEPYHMPAVRAVQDQYHLVPVQVCLFYCTGCSGSYVCCYVISKQTSAQNILCTANLQHCCEPNKCSISATTPIYEERQRTEKTKPAVQHIGNADDLVLNTARMRDARFMRRLRSPLESLTMDSAILEGTAREINLRCAAAKVVSHSTTTSRDQSRGRRRTIQSQTNQHEPIASTSTSQQHIQVRSLAADSRTRN